MTSTTMRGVRISLWLVAAGAISAGGGAAAQQAVRYPAGAVVQALPSADAGAELRRHLTELAANPRNVSALIGAGRAALEVGDGQAALGFFARADEFAPRDARVKAGMASAFVQLEQPQAALRFFAEAVQLGAPEAEIAADRGLAYDMVGNPRRAQQDYAMLLQRGATGQDEVRRRLALSLAISGNRAAALAALDPLLRRQDRAASRTRAFVLALTGDSAGAAQAVEASLPGQSSAMAPFLSRLAALSPAQKAMAVHFGRFPADGRPVRIAEAVDTSAHPAAVALTGAGPAVPAARQSAPAPVSRRRTAPAPARTEPRRRPGTDNVAPPPRVGLAARYPTRTERPAAQPTQVARDEPAAVRSQPVQTPPPREEPATSRPDPLPTQQIVIAEAQPGFTLPASTPPPEPSRRSEAPAEPPPPVDTAAAAEPAPEFADIAALVQSLPEETEDRPAAAPQRRSAAASPVRAASGPATQRLAPARTAPARARTQPAAPAHPSRHWVQLAGGNRAAFNFQLARIRQSAPELLRGRHPYWAVNGNSNRLLVGPFPTPRAAQDFVNQLARQQVAAFAWTSQAGQEVERLPAR